MRYIRDGLKSDLGAIKGTSTGRTTRLQLLGTAFLALLFGLGLVLTATRLIEDILNLSRNAAHDFLRQSPF